LRTVGDKWAYLEQYKFGHLTQPFYVPVSPQGKPLTKPYSYNEDISKFLEFLAEGLSH
jgi:thiol:disulfide interchange protein DsbD